MHKYKYTNTIYSNTQIHFEICPKYSLLFSAQIVRRSDCSHCPLPIFNLSYFLTKERIQKSYLPNVTRFHNINEYRAPYSSWHPSGWLWTLRACLTLFFAPFGHLVRVSYATMRQIVRNPKESQRNFKKIFFFSFFRS